MRKSLVFLSLILLVYSVWAQSTRRTASATASIHFPPAAIAAFQKIDAERISRSCPLLSHDLLEGRGNGQRGGDIAAEYIATQFSLYGLKPRRRITGTYLQKVSHGRGHTSAGNDIFSGVCERLKGIEAALRLCCLR